MGKKKGNKKQEDDFWDEAGEPAAETSTSSPAQESGEPSIPKSKPSPFTNMIPDEPEETADLSDDGGGLMGAMNYTSKKSAKEKKSGKKDKKKQKNDDFDFDEFAEDVEGNAEKKEEEDKVEEQGQGEDKDSAAASKPQKAATDKEDDAEKGDEEDDGAPRILTKKEKEKLKKEKEKAKKKAQAEAKKKAAPKEDNEEAATSPVAASKPAASTSTTNDQPKESAEPADDDAEAEDGEGTTAADKKKKKKKKKGEKAEPAAPAPKKTSAAVQALQARLAAQKKAEEEAEAAHQEALRREEEAERLEKEELEKKEAERARKKEKEKAKKEQLRKEGKLLTPKQKAEKAAAEARMKAMIQSGQIKVEGLEKKEKDEDEGGEKKKRVVYDSKKKKGKGIPAKGPAPPPLSPPTPSSPAIDEEKVDLPTPSATPETTATPAEEEAAEDWDAPSEKEEEEDDDVKDDWDAESEEEEEKKAPTPAPVKVETQEAEKKKKESSKAKEAPKATTSKKPETAPAPKANGRAPATPAPKKEAAAKSSKPAAAAEESSEEESSDDDDDDSDDDSDSDDSDSDDESSEDDDGLTNTQRQAAQRKAEAAQRRKERTEQAMLNRNKDDLRSPICCILGHVDTGKTKLLDKVRQTNVQEGEAGGITQQIGATYFPVENIKQKTQVLTDYKDLEYKIPGLLVIDTPGHESFANLRTRGSSLCNIAILVVDIMHGLEPQTLESIRLLRDKKTPFIVALNKIDRLYGWKATPNGGFKESLAQQNRATQQEFERRVEETIVAFAEQSLNSCLYYENKNLGKNVSLVPTSAHTGEGIPDMLQLLVSLTQNRMSERLMYLSELECTVLEVKVIEGLGTTIDVVLSNGVLNEGDRIVVCGLNGPIVTNVRALLTPQPLKEMRVKGSYVHHKQIKAAMGVKITAPDLEKAIAGSRLLVCGPDDDEEELMDEVMSDLKGLLNSIERSDRGVAVQASTLGSLEALLEFLKQSKIPVSTVNIGPVFKKDVVRIMPMLEKAKEMACMLCFDVAVDKDAEALADANGIKVFKADIIYHLFDAFTAYRAQMLEAKKKDAAPTAVWPCRLSTIAAFAKRDPIILGCDIIDGSLRVGTPLCVVKVDEATKKKSIVYLGKVTSLEINHKTRDIVQKKDVGGGVAVKIEHAVYESSKIFGRHFDEKDEIISMISRVSIDSLKDNFWSEVSQDEKRLIKKLKTVIGID